MMFRFFCVVLAMCVLNGSCRSESISSNDLSSQDGKDDGLRLYCSEGKCGRKLGDICSHSPGSRCSKGLTCRYHDRSSLTGVCIVPAMKPCRIGRNVFKHGEKFSLDCRTRCICVNGTYACASRCPNEKISPRGSCFSPRLVYFPGHCCRQWLCVSPTATVPPKCVENATPWSECSTTCGVGLSTRSSNINPSCEMRKETRLCQRNSCTQIAVRPKVHRVRRKHFCKATQRCSGMHLKLDSCVSHRRYAPRHCGPCAESKMCCKPVHTKTISVAVRCDDYVQFSRNETEVVLVNWSISGEDMWKRHKAEEPTPEESRVVKVEWVLKCKCSRTLCEDMHEIAERNVTHEALLHRVHRTSSMDVEY